MTQYFAPLDDLKFILDDVLKIQELFSLTNFRHANLTLVHDILISAARLAEEKISPINSIGDAEGAKLVDGGVYLPSEYSEMWKIICSGGWLGLDLPEENGGQALPRLLQAAFAEMTNGACVSFCMLPLMSRAAVRMLLEHGSPHLIEDFVDDLVSGEVTATICISEPGSGSDVGRIETRAMPMSDGTFQISGSKTWISYGDHQLSSQIAHMVLARTPDSPQGTRGLSLFLVPKMIADTECPRLNGVQVNSLESKMGLSASPTCTLNFDQSKAWQLGSLGEGLTCIFTMVNTMRLEVAIQGVSIAGAATERAFRYAAERAQGGPANHAPVKIISHPDVRRMLMIMRARTETLRALTLEAAHQFDVAEHGDSDDIRLNASLLVEWLLPICKASATDAAVEVSNLCIQVHGGSGYVKDTGVEQYVRDARVGSIYEGTNGIQALDLVTRKLVKDNGIRYEIFVRRIQEDLERTKSDESISRVHSAVSHGLENLEKCAEVLRNQGRDEVEHLAAATPFLRIASLVGCGWMCLRMASVANTESVFDQRKRNTVEFFVTHLMTEIYWLADQVMSGASALYELEDEIFIGN